MDNSLWAVCERTFFPRNLRIGPDTKRQYRYALDDWASVLGRPPALDDLNDDAILLWVRALLDRQPPLSPWTVNEKVGRAKTLWSFLAKRGIVREFCTVPRLPCPEPVPRAWSVKQLAALFAAADLEGGMIGPVPARLWWRARTGFHFGTGARKGEGDVLRQEWCDLERGWIVVPPQFRKGRKKRGCYRMPDWLVYQFQRIWQPQRDLVFPFDRCEGIYYRTWNRILKNAGLPAGRRSKTQALRITFATMLRQMGGDPTKALMHSDPATTLRYYLDATFDEPQQVMPDPELPWVRPEWEQRS